MCCFQGGLEDVGTYTAAERRIVCSRKCTYAHCRRVTPYKRFKKIVDTLYNFIEFLLSVHQITTVMHLCVAYNVSEHDSRERAMLLLGHTIGSAISHFPDV